MGPRGFSRDNSREDAGGDAVPHLVGGSTVLPLSRRLAGFLRRCCGPLDVLLLSRFHSPRLKLALHTSGDRARWCTP